MRQAAIAGITQGRPGSDRAILRQILPPVLVAYACLLPRELSFEIEGAAIFPYRLVLYLFAPLLLTRIARDPPRFGLIDVVALFVSTWYVVSLLVTTSGLVALVNGVALGADFGLAYLVGRACVRTSEEFRRFLGILLPGLLLVALILAVESLSHRMLLRPVLAGILNQPPPNVGEEVRMGLMRATGPFPHPILAGVFMASILPVAWYAATRGWQRVLAFAVAASAVFTVSAGAVLSFAVGGMLIALDLAQRLTRLPAFLIALAYGVGGALFISVASESGFWSFVFRRMTLNPESGYYRALIWEYAGAEATQHPFFGIGMRDWARPSFMGSDSIDAHWLLLAVRYGMPLAFGVLLVLAGAAASVLRANRRGSRLDRGTSLGLAFTLVIFAFAGFTVALWEGIDIWMIMLSGMAVSILPVAQPRDVPPSRPGNP